MGSLLVRDGEVFVFLGVLRVLVRPDPDLEVVAFQVVEIGGPAGLEVLVPRLVQVQLIWTRKQVKI